MSGIVPEVPPRRPFDLNSTIQVLHWQIDMADAVEEARVVPLHRTFAYDVLRHLYILREAQRAASEGES